MRRLWGLIALAGLLIAQPKLPRTAAGHPDLQGIWTNATITPLERLAVFGPKLALTDSEAAAYEKMANAQTYGDERSSNAQADRDHAYNALFFDKGTELARVGGQKRTSLIVNPPAGKMPARTPEGVQRLAERGRSYSRFDRVQDRPPGERCLLGFGSTSGPPMLPVLYNNNYQIVQTPGTILVLVEMVHDARMIHMDRKAHLGPEVRSWLGDSVGRWEGNTLVVDTTNFNGQHNFLAASTSLHTVERFTLVDAGTILYQVTIDDPLTFTKPFTLEYPFRAAPGPIYEYACHEGNYAMVDILGGARKEELEKQR